MRRLPFILLILLFQGCRTNQQKAAQESEIDASGRENPGFEFSEQIHHFGTIRSGEIVAYTFVFRNPGPGDLELGKTETGCSCITVTADKKRIRQGEEGKIEVIFNSAGLYGIQYHTIRIISPEENIRKDLAVSAEVIQ
jgi:hypothetical protein